MSHDPRLGRTSRDYCVGHYPRRSISCRRRVDQRLVAGAGPNGHRQPVWLVRGLVFQYMADSALVAYETQYWRFREFAAGSATQPLPADRIRHIGAR